MKAILCFLAALFLSSCSVSDAGDQTSPTPSLPSPEIPASLLSEGGGLPVLSVYVLSGNVIEQLDIERYVAGVVAGEMRSDWPMEALRAQAILARTFVLKFVSEKESRYPGADISTDIAEAQAYNASAVNDRIEEAVLSTRGMVLSTADGTLPYAWFHAHSGGVTALAQEGLDWQEAEPDWTISMRGLDSPAAPVEAQKWSASFSTEAFLAACRKAGGKTRSPEPLAIAQKGASGRAITLSVGGSEVNAARLRLALGSTVMRSTLLTQLEVKDGRVHMAGRGYGHGVGMPQWGAYALALDGYPGEDIATHYFQGLRVVCLW